MRLTGKAKIYFSKLGQNTSTYLAVASGVLILALIVVVVYEVWMRFVVNEPAGWAVEVPRLLFLVIIFLGLAYTTRLEGHVNLDLITTRLGKSSRGLLKAITSLLALAVSAVLLWRSVTILVDAYVQTWYTATVVRIIQWPFFIAMVVGTFVMCLEWIGKMVAGWRDFRNQAVAPKENI